MLTALLKAKYACFHMFIVLSLAYIAIASRSLSHMLIYLIAESQRFEGPLYRMHP